MGVGLGAGRDPAGVLRRGGIGGKEGSEFGAGLDEEAGLQAESAGGEWKARRLAPQAGDGACVAWPGASERDVTRRRPCPFSPLAGGAGALWRREDGGRRLVRVRSGSRPTVQVTTSTLPGPGVGGGNRAARTRRSASWLGPGSG